MAQTMARIKNNIVVGLEWWDDYKKETEDLKFTGDVPVAHGDEYKEGKYYRDGKVVLTNEEVLQNSLSTYAKGINDISTTLELKTETMSPEQEIDKVVNTTVDIKNAMTILGLQAEEAKA